MLNQMHIVRQINEIATFSKVFREAVVVLKELIFNSVYLGGCGGLERTDFNSFYFGEGLVVLKEI